MTDTRLISILGLVDRCEVLRADGSVDEQPALNGAFVNLYGWLFGYRAKLVAIWVTIGGKAVAAEPGFHRPDVSAHLRTPEASWCGFRATTLLSGLAPGVYDLSVEAVDNHGRLYCTNGESRKLVVAESFQPPRALAKVDEVLVDDVELSEASSTRIDAESTVFLRGWALTHDLRTGLDLVLGAAGGGAIQYGLERPDLVQAFGEHARFGGFTVTLTGSALLASRENRLKLSLLAPNGAALLATDVAIELSAKESHLIVRQ